MKLSYRPEINGLRAIAASAALSTILKFKLNNNI